MKGLQNIFATWKNETSCRNIYRLLKKKMAQRSLTRMETVKETKDFYEQLYESREMDVVDVDLHTMVEAPTLSSEEKESLEELISEEEALAVFMRMNNQKSPGSDGFTT